MASLSLDAAVFYFIAHRMHSNSPLLRRRAHALPGEPSSDSDGSQRWLGVHCCSGRGSSSSVFLSRFCRQAQQAQARSDLTLTCPIIMTWLASCAAHRAHLTGAIDNVIATTHARLVLSAAQRGALNGLRTVENAPIKSEPLRNQLAYKPSNMGAGSGKFVDHRQWCAWLALCVTITPALALRPHWVALGDTERNASRAAYRHSIETPESLERLRSTSSSGSLLVAPEWSRDRTVF